jgi:Fusaric acid resistance protein family
MGSMECRFEKRRKGRGSAAALWAAVLGIGVSCLYIAFWLELDNAFWAGTSAAIVCQPHLGASLRKGSVSDTLLYGARMTAIGASATRRGTRTKAVSAPEADIAVPVPL